MAAMSAQVQHLVEQKLPEATRSVLQENSELQSLLGQLSVVSRSLQRENAALRERKKQLSIDTDILEETLRRAARASCLRQKVRGRVLQRLPVRTSAVQLCSPSGRTAAHRRAAAAAAGRQGEAAAAGADSGGAGWSPG